MLRKVAQHHDIPFIVDETKTGMGASGKNWAHEHWFLNSDLTPDFVTFGGKSGLAGFFSTVNYRLIDSEAASFHQQVDMVKLLHYGQIWNIIAKQNLLHLQSDTSSFLKIELERVGRETGLVRDVRGYGTHLAFDCP